MVNKFNIYAINPKTARRDPICQSQDNCDKFSMYAVNLQATTKNIIKYEGINWQQKSNKIIKNTQLTQKKAKTEGKGNKEQMGQTENKQQDSRFKLNHVNNPIKYKCSKHSN